MQSCGYSVGLDLVSQGGMIALLPPPWSKLRTAMALFIRKVRKFSVSAAEE